MGMSKKEIAANVASTGFSVTDGRFGVAPEELTVNRFARKHFPSGRDSITVVVPLGDVAVDGVQVSAGTAVFIVEGAAVPDAAALLDTESTLAFSVSGVNHGFVPPKPKRKKRGSSEPAGEVESVDDSSDEQADVSGDTE